MHRMVPNYHKVGGPLACYRQSTCSYLRSSFCKIWGIVHGAGVDVGPMHHDHGTYRGWTWNYIPGYGLVVVDKFVEWAS